MPKDKKGLFVPLESVVSRIFLVRGQKVMLDADLTELYGVTTKRLNEQVKRNIDRFPPDFMFQLNTKEYDSLRSQFATLKRGRGQHRKYLPYVFTEHGAIMASSVLDSDRAVQVSIHVVRAFVQLREMLSSNKELARKLNELERKLTTHDRAITELIEAIRQLMTLPEPKKKRPIGFCIPRHPRRYIPVSGVCALGEVAAPRPAVLRAGKAVLRRRLGGRGPLC